MHCETAREQLLILSGGERLPGWVDYVCVGSHLLRCAGCREAWRGFRRLRSLCRDLPASPLPVELRSRVLEGLPSIAPVAWNPTAKGNV